MAENFLKKNYTEISILISYAYLPHSEIDQVYNYWRHMKLNVVDSSYHQGMVCILLISVERCMCLLDMEPDLPFLNQVNKWMNEWTWWTLFITRAWCAFCWFLLSAVCVCWTWSRIYHSCIILGEIFSFVSVCSLKWCICKMVIYEMNEKYLLLDICILADILRNLFYLWHLGKFQVSIVYMLLVHCQRCTNLK